MIRLRRRKKFTGNRDENDGCEEKDTEDGEGGDGGGDLGAIAYNFALIQTKVVHYFRLFAQKVFYKLNNVQVTENFGQ